MGEGLGGSPLVPPRGGPPGSAIESGSAGSVPVVPECAECGERWLPADEERWRLVLVDDAELVWYCARCFEEEFGGDA